MAEKEKERQKATRLQRKEALERQRAEEESERQRQSAQELRIRLAAVQRNLAKERKHKEAVRNLVDQLGDKHQRPQRKCSRPPDVEKAPPITVRIVFFSLLQKNVKLLLSLLFLIPRVSPRHRILSQTGG